MTQGRYTERRKAYGSRRRRRSLAPSSQHHDSASRAGSSRPGPGPTRAGLFGTIPQPTTCSHFTATQVTPKPFHYDGHLLPATLPHTHSLAPEK